VHFSAFSLFSTFDPGEEIQGEGGIIAGDMDDVVVVVPVPLGAGLMRKFAGGMKE
jgi:hypothetical protein